MYYLSIKLFNLIYNELKSKKKKLKIKIIQLNYSIELFN